MSEPNPQPYKAPNTPVLAMIAALVLVVCAVVLIVTAKPGQNETTLVVGLVVTSVPGLLAAAFSERNSRDLRNGVLQNKVREGAHQALHESGVTAVAQAALQSNPASMAALARLVDALDNHDMRVTPPTTSDTPPEGK